MLVLTASKRINGDALLVLEIGAQTVHEAVGCWGGGGIGDAAGQPGVGHAKDSASFVVAGDNRGEGKGG